MSNISIELKIIFVILMVCVSGYNLIYLKKYNDLMSYLKRHYPEIYERIRLKPDVGPLYSSGKNHYKESLDYAKNHEPLDDPTAERLLADYAKFHEKGTWLFGVVFVVFSVGVAVWGALR